MSDKKKADPHSKVETTGHTWDGIQELNNPMPRWWLWTLYATVLWAIGYVIAYPAWPMLSGATAGVLGWSTRADVAAEITAHDAKNAALVTALLAADMPSLSQDADLNRYANARGAAVFRANCSQCHGSGAAGAKGYPNLLDDDWLWGGTLEDVLLTVRHGVRNTTDAQARFSQMPAFKDILDADQIGSVAEYVISLGGGEADAPLAAKGAPVFAENCASCHGEKATGSREQGAPNLTDAIWLYGGDRETVVATVTDARFGIMPAWGHRLTEADVRAVAVYVHSLGGGE